MAIVKSRWAKGERTWIRPQTSGATHVTQFTYDVGAEGALAVGDILELGVIPVNARITHATLTTEGTFTGLTADIGVMTGEVGADFMPDGSTARTSGNEFWSAVDLTAALSSLSKKEPLLLPQSEAERSIGVKVSAAVPAAAGKRIHLWLFYHQ